MDKKGEEMLTYHESSNPSWSVLLTFYDDDGGDGGEKDEDLEWHNFRDFVFCDADKAQYCFKGKIINK